MTSVHQNSARPTPLQADILAAMPGPEEAPITARAIHVRMDCWAPVSVRTRLIGLCKEGLVDRFETGGACLYRRAA